MNILIINGSVDKNELDPYWIVPIDTNISIDNIVSILQLPSDYQLVLYDNRQARKVIDINSLTNVLLNDTYPVIAVMDNCSYSIDHYLDSYSQFMLSKIFEPDSVEDITLEATNKFFTNIEDIASKCNRTSKDIINHLLSDTTKFYIVYELLLERWNVNVNDWKNIYINSEKDGYTQILDKLELDRKRILMSGESYIVDGKGRTIGRFKLSEEHRGGRSKKISRDYDNSLVVMKSPWVVVPIMGKCLKIDDNYIIINLTKTHRKVEKTLESKNHEILLKKWTDETQGLEAWDNGDDEEEVSSYHICFNVADYIAHLWGFPYNTPVTRYTMTWQELSFHRGVFHCYNENAGDESHAFVVWLYKDTITIYQGYGGWIYPWIKTFELKTWLAGMIAIARAKLRGDQIKLLIKYFGFPEEIIGDIRISEKNEPAWLFEDKIECFRIA